MWFDLHMDDAHNDTELTFTTLAAATARVVSKLAEHQEHGSSDSDAGHKEEEIDTEHDRYVRYRMRQFAIFERRSAGKD